MNVFVDFGWCERQRREMVHQSLARVLVVCIRIGACVANEWSVRVSLGPLPAGFVVDPKGHAAGGFWCGVVRDFGWLTDSVRLVLRCHGQRLNTIH